MKHLTDEQLSAYLDGALTGRTAEDAARHIAACAPCREALAELAAQDESLAPLLTHDPGDQYFETFAARVEDRVRAAGLAGAQRRAEGFDFGRWFRSPRTLAWAGAVAVVVVGGGLALMTAHEGISPTERFRKVDELTRAPQEPATPPPTAPGAPAEPAPSSAPYRAQESRPREITSRAPTQTLMTPDESKQRAKTSAELRGAAPSRAIEVRQTPSGEEVAVPRKDMPSFAPAPAPAAPSTAGNVAGTTVKKPAQAGLMKQSGSAPAPSTAPLESEFRDQAKAAPTQSFAAPPSAATRNEGAAKLQAEPGEVRVCGSVLDSRGRAIAGAQVVASDLGRSTVADAAGRFCLSLPPGEHPLTAMAIGYAAGHRTLAAVDRDVQLTLQAVPVLESDGKVAKREALAYQELTEKSPGSFADLPDSLARGVREAQRLESAALTHPSAGAYDAAAGAWQRSLSTLERSLERSRAGAGAGTGGPLEIEARRHLATARYRAWQLAPTPARAGAAVEALTAYVSRAPAGPERTQASAWLDHVRP